MTSQRPDGSDGARRWHFRRMGKAEMNDDPIQGEFFTNQDIADRLVRETLQNSLDAAMGSDRVVVRFTLRSSGPSDSEGSGQYFRGLHPHLDQTLDGNAPGRAELDNLRGRSGTPFLLIEDFNTKGLTGDVEQYQDLSSSESSDDNHFYWFVRNVGRSGKRGLEGGSWGVGKWVFPDASKINTFFFLTRRLDNPRSLLMGQSVLKMHVLDGDRYYPYGHYADIEDDSDFALPISDQSQVQIFKDDFALARREETGLSIIVPFPEDDLERDSLLRAVIRYYFSPILSGRLVVHVSDESEDVQVNYDSIYNIVDQIDWGSSGSRLSPQDQRRMFDLVQNLATLSDQDRITIEEPEPRRDPTREPIQDRFQTGQMEDARSRFEGGEAVAFRIRTWVHPKGVSPKLSWLDLIVQRDPALSGIHTEYVRNDLTIPEAGRRGVGVSSNFRSLLIANEPHLAALLRDSEEPSHSRWNERSPRVRDHYDLGASTVRFVNRAVRSIVQCLTATQEGVDRDLLKEFFSIGIRGNRRVTPPDPNGPRRSPAIVTRRENGFNLRVTGVDGQFARRLRIRAAYRTRRGNSLTRYDPRDFNLNSSEFVIIYDGCTMDEVELNQMLVNVDEVDATVTVRGFDPNRDLLVQVDEIEQEQ